MRLRKEKETVLSWYGTGLPKPLTILLALAISMTVEASDGPGEDYFENLKKTRAEHAEQLKSGWQLDVIARPTLKSGSQTIGSGKNNDIVIGICPDRLGTIRVANGVIHLTLGESARAGFQGTKHRAGEMKKGYGDGNRIECEDGFLYANTDGELRIVKPGAGPDPIPRFFDIAARWRIAGRYHPFPKPVERMAARTNGKEDLGYVLGYVTFELGGVKYQMEPQAWPMEWAEKTIMTLAFRDDTSGKSTYGGGRYVNLEAPLGKGVEQDVIIDFNTAYNPLCVFDSNVACLLPPLQNRLRTAVEAGERTPAES